MAESINLTSSVGLPEAKNSDKCGEMINLEAVSENTNSFCPR